MKSASDVHGHALKARSCLCVSVKLMRGMRGIMREQKVVRVRANAQNERIIHGVELGHVKME